MLFYFLLIGYFGFALIQGRRSRPPFQCTRSMILHPLQWESTMWAPTRAYRQMLLGQSNFQKHCH